MAEYESFHLIGGFDPQLQQFVSYDEDSDSLLQPVSGDIENLQPSQRKSTEQQLQTQQLEKQQSQQEPKQEQIGYDNILSSQFAFHQNIQQQQHQRQQEQEQEQFNLMQQQFSIEQTDSTTSTTSQFISTLNPPTFALNVNGIELSSNVVQSMDIPSRPIETESFQNIPVIQTPSVTIQPSSIDSDKNDVAIFNFDQESWRDQDDVASLSGSEADFSTTAESLSTAGSPSPTLPPMMGPPPPIFDLSAPFLTVPNANHRRKISSGSLAGGFDELKLTEELSEPLTPERYSRSAPTGDSLGPHIIRVPSPLIRAIPSPEPSPVFESDFSLIGPSTGNSRAFSLDFPYTNQSHSQDFNQQQHNQFQLHLPPSLLHEEITNFGNAHTLDPSDPRALEALISEFNQYEFDYSSSSDQLSPYAPQSASSTATHSRNPSVDFAPAGLKLGDSRHPSLQHSVQHSRESSNISDSVWDDVPTTANDAAIRAKLAKMDKSKSHRSTLYQCPYPECGKAFTRPYNLKSHYRSHTGERPFFCGFCPSTFSRKHDLKRHEKLHGGTKPYVCQACSKAFARSDALRRHLKCSDPEKESQCSIRLKMMSTNNEAENQTAAQQQLQQLNQESPVFVDVKLPEQQFHKVENGLLETENANSELETFNA